MKDFANRIYSFGCVVAATILALVLRTTGSAIANSLHPSPGRDWRPFPG
jgi:hypothetical protein